MTQTILPLPVIIGILTVIIYFFIYRPLDKELEACDKK